MTTLVPGFEFEPQAKTPIAEALEIANEYLQGGDRGEAVTQLKTMGSFGFFLAAEIVIDYAIDDSPNMASTWHPIAEDLLKGCLKRSPQKPDRTNPGLIPTEHARAAMRLTQLPLLTYMLRNGRLPNESRVRGTYNQLISLGQSVKTNHESETREPNGHSKEVTGVINEIAVLGLAMRFPLTSGIGAETWLPLQSRFRDDHGGSCLAGTGSMKTEPCVDLDIYTTPDGRQPAKTFSLQIKGYDYDRNAQPNTLYIDPDLRINSGDRHISAEIIKELNGEIDPTVKDATRLTGNLDQRTDQLLDRIDLIS